MRQRARKLTLILGIALLLLVCSFGLLSRHRFGIHLEIGGHHYSIGGSASVDEFSWRANTLRKNPTIRSLRPLSGGLAWFLDANDKWGAVDDAGEVKIPAIYDMTWDFRRDRANVVLDGRWALIDSTGKAIVGPDINIDRIASYDDETYTIIYADGSNTRIDREGRPCNPPESMPKQIDTLPMHDTLPMQK